MFHISRHPSWRVENKQTDDRLLMCCFSLRGESSDVFFGLCALFSCILWVCVCCFLLEDFGVPPFRTNKINKELVVKLVLIKSCHGNQLHGKMTPLPANISTSPLGTTVVFASMCLRCHQEAKQRYVIRSRHVPFNARRENERSS